MSAAKRVLLCGHRSYAAKGLEAELARRGYQVTGYSRGAVRRGVGLVTGPVDRIHLNEHLEDRYDTLVNYILLKDASLQENIDYLASLLELCRNRQVAHLVHISSVSSFTDEM